MSQGEQLASYDSLVCDADGDTEDGVLEGGANAAHFAATVNPFLHLTAAVTSALDTLDRVIDPQYSAQYLVLVRRADVNTISATDHVKSNLVNRISEMN